MRAVLSFSNQRRFALRVASELAAEMGEEPEEKRESGAKDKASGDGEIKCRVLAAMDDVTGKFSEAKRESPTEEEKSASEDKEAAEKEKSAAEFAERVHKSDCRGSEARK